MHLRRALFVRATAHASVSNGIRLTAARSFAATPARPEPVRARLPEDDTQGVVPRSITRWFKKEGDAVKVGEALCEVDAGDVVYDFNSPVSGFVVRITAKEGSVGLKGGEVIAFLAGAQDQITSVAYEAAKEIAEHKVELHDVPDKDEPKKVEAAEVKEDELTEWLRKTAGNDELLEYVPAMRSEGFSTVESVKNLEEDDFESLGITKRGHRKALLAAVQALKAKTPAAA